MDTQTYDNKVIFVSWPAATKHFMVNWCISRKHEWDASKTIELNYKRKQHWIEEKDRTRREKNVCLLRWKSAASFASVNLSSWLYRVLIQRAQLISHENMEWIRFLMIAFNTFWSDETNPTRFLCTICVRSQRDVQSLPMNWYGQINGIQYIYFRCFLFH